LKQALNLRLKREIEPASTVLESAGSIHLNRHKIQPIKVPPTLMGLKIWRIDNIQADQHFYGHEKKRWLRCSAGFARQRLRLV
jgi:hypothetical protein